MRWGRDYHIHTHYLGCGNATMQVEAIVRRAEELGLRSIAITDHLNTLDRLPDHQKIRDELVRIETGIEVYFGCELNILDLNAALPYGSDVAREMGFELAIAGVHRTWLDPQHATPQAVLARQTDLLIKLASCPLVDVVVHPWWFGRAEYESVLAGWLTSMDAIPREMTRDFVQAAADNGVAIEVNATASFLPDYLPDTFKASYADYVALLVDYGATLSIASDAHDISKLGTTTIVEDLLERLGVSDDRIWYPSLPPCITGSHLATS
ncbi:PHP domain-containing protein [Planctomycetota bacterium]